ncbi:hypothetical protein GCM10010441_18070 [Kitasatospora paracochleata]|uniref:Uncharacterized protein n=1 Tax=Kitasatospora paracochleata TaxID=58354 RepID=A0ABT1JAS8_9ACTN|nr:hypothetical protein [Kitasatospora paracochleata]MCP2314161.1 hypothetical protein [Kitasatospora paracochleata]
MHTELDHLAYAAAPYAHFTGYDPQAGRRRIAAKIAALKQQQAAPRRDDPRPARPESDGRALTFQQHAERDLRTLATCIINDDDAPDHLHGLIVTSRDIEPKGGLVFAALLYLSGHPRHAQFWFQFAAGSGESNAAYALFLHHAALGELRDAEHWYHETAQLMDEADPSLPAMPPPPSIPRLDLYLFNIPWHSQHLPDDTTDLARPDPKLRSTVDDLDTVREDDRFGVFVLPTETIAEQLHDLVCQ